MPHGHSRGPAQHNRSGAMGRPCEDRTFMLALLVVTVTWLASAVLGRSLIDLALKHQPGDPRALRPGENFVFASALGLGLTAYGVFALGLCGMLSGPYIASLLAAVAILGIPG